MKPWQQAHSLISVRCIRETLTQCTPKRICIRHKVPMDRQNPFAVAVAAHMSRNSEKAMCQFKRLAGGTASQEGQSFFCAW